jgi:hypothetical protein
MKRMMEDLRVAAETYTKADKALERACGKRDMVSHFESK